MAREKWIWAIAIAEIYPMGDVSVTTTGVAKDLSKASDMLDRLIWTYIKEYGYAVENEINTAAKSTVVMQNVSLLRTVIITCTKTPLQ